MDIHNHASKYMQTHLIPLLLGPPSRWTDWEQSSNAGRRLYTPFSSRFLPPSINPTSLILHLHYDRCLSPALFIIPTSFTYPPLPSRLALPIFHFSLPLVSFFISQVQTLCLLCPSPPSFFISFVNFTLERHIQQVRNERTVQGDNIILSLFLSQFPFYFWSIIHISGSIWSYNFFGNILNLLDKLVTVYFN